MSIEAMELALEALKFVNQTGDTQTFDMCYADKAITAIENALAQPEEAQSALSLFQSGFIDGREKGLKEALAQPQRKPLTDEQIQECWYRTQGDAELFARAIEAAHGIKE